ncbi:hypothetical protein BD309DRAFT_123664 [Dichomitus squalens]|nr:hypothetical protein BD309DRAFT_123664 [Dichomitus squalens]
MSRRGGRGLLGPGALVSGIRPSLLLLCTLSIDCPCERVALCVVAFRSSAIYLPLYDALYMPEHLLCSRFAVSLLAVVRAILQRLKCVTKLLALSSSPVHSVVYPATARMSVASVHTNGSVPIITDSIRHPSACLAMD